MSITEKINSHQGTAFSFEVLPPLKGTGTANLFRTIEKLKEFDPLYINITSHRSEYVYHDLEGGLVQRQRVRRRPGTIAIAAAIQQRFGLPVVPHVVCSGNCREDLEYMLIDLQFLGIGDLLVLRGDKAREESTFKPTGDGPAHATELIEQTQLFYDNEKYFSFVERARAAGIDIPIIPGIKPLAKLSQLTMVPKTFHCDLPEALYHEALKCRTDEEVKQVGIEWGVEQCRQLMQHGVKSLHFYTVSAVDSIAQIAQRIY